jgi:hypothetical protein
LNLLVAAFTNEGFYPLESGYVGRWFVLLGSEIEEVQTVAVVW